MPKATLTSLQNRSVTAFIVSRRRLRDCFSTTHDILRYGLLLANNGELDRKHYLSPSAMDELRKEQTGETKVNYGLGYHLRNGMFGHDGAFGTDLSVNPTNGMVAVFMTQSTSDDKWAARDLFLKTATQIYRE